MSTRTITVAGAGITGLWQALTLARRGHRVRLVERASDPLALSASAYAGAMLAPYCETEAAAPVILDLGLESIGLWRENFPGTVTEGSLVVASARDAGEVERFARLTEGHARLDGAAIAKLEPDLVGRFATGLFYAGEAHVAPRDAMRFLLEEARRAGVQVALGAEWPQAVSSSDVIASSVQRKRSACFMALSSLRSAPWIRSPISRSIEWPARMAHRPDGLVIRPGCTPPLQTASARKE